MGASTLSVPSGANGLGRPSFPSGISMILESRKLLNALSEKIASSNFIFLTFKSKERKSLATRGLWFEVIVSGIVEKEENVGLEEEIKSAWGWGFFIKKI